MKIETAWCDTPACWSAFVAPQDESSRICYGKTEREAIDTLVEEMLNMAYRESDEELSAIVSERDTLGRAVANAAQRAGIYNGEGALGGAQLVQLCDDMASALSDSQWVACAERMPPLRRVVIVEGGVAQFIRNSTGEGRWLSLTGFNWPGSQIQWEVTHWMPLPEQPK